MYECQNSSGISVKSKSKYKPVKSRKAPLPRLGWKQCDMLRRQGSSVPGREERCQASQMETSLGGPLGSGKKLKTIRTQASVQQVLICFTWSQDLAIVKQ